ncbi:RDD family protein [Ornithinimicrobium flavum]|uniref:RDD family protein n=1 Tax=Ornithinimicrobium flavum TaxID=1288636 RepID=UPI0010700117|nr:RDD family protein [Ornithinimicrobium flavum]
MTTSPHQGASLGLPATGPGAVGSVLRRLVALVLDWTLCQLIATSFLGMQWGQVSGAQAFGPLVLFFVLNLVLVTTMGATIGHRLLGLRVVSLDCDGWLPPPPGRSALRALLLCLFVPALIMDADTRGLHDKAARSVVIRTR